jgi:hypothetical protein
VHGAAEKSIGSKSGLGDVKEGERDPRTGRVALDPQALDADLAAIVALEPVDAAQRRRLACARQAADDDDAAARGGLATRGLRATKFTCSATSPPA